MPDDTGIRKSNVRWQSDVIVDLIKRFGFAYLPLNPGASFRGLHDSLVNYGEDEPPMLLCNHEKIAVQIAHGYAKATGEPLCVIVHDVVGLLHAPLAIYYAYIDRAPIMILGATGPVDEKLRRPFIDWIHTASVQGNAVRDFTKWDYQPGGIAGVPDSFARAYSIMMSEPQGPVYLCFDAGLQEAPLTQEVALPGPDAVRAPSRIAPDPDTLAEVADRLLASEHPVLLAEYSGRAPIGFDPLVELAETVGAPVVDTFKRLNFPNRHPLNLSMDGTAFDTADLVVALDVVDWTYGSHVPDAETREIVSRTPPGCQWIDIGFADIEISKWATDYNKHRDWDLRVLADTALAIPALTELCRERIEGDRGLAARIDERAAATAERHAALRARWHADAEKGWDAEPIAPSRLAAELWAQIEEEDWVLTAGSLGGWARKLWDFDRSYRHPGRPLGTSTQLGISLGVALAHKRSGRLVVDLQPDGDLMFDLGALWMAARYEIPMLVVMFNNRAYYNDWHHQIQVARRRGTDPGRANIGMDIVDPPPDFARIAQGLGWYAEGPIESPADIAPALTRAIAEVKAGKPALVDTVTAHR